MDSRDSPPTEEPFDNDVTLRYKWALYYHIPLDFVITRQVDGKHVYESIFDFCLTVYEHFIQGEDHTDLSVHQGIVEAILENVKRTSPDTRPEDLLFAYLTIVREHEEFPFPSKNVYTREMFYAFKETLLQFEKEDQLVLIKNNFDLYSLQDVWSRSREKRTTQMMIGAEKIHKIQSKLSKAKPLLASPLTVDHITYLCTLYCTPYSIYDMALQLLNEVKVSPLVPVVRLNLQGRSYYKVYQMSADPAEQRYLYHKMESKKTDNTMFFRVCVTREFPDELKDESFEYCSLDLTRKSTRGQLMISNPILDQHETTIVKDHLLQALPLATSDSSSSTDEDNHRLQLQIVDDRQSKLNGVFRLYECEMDPYVMHYLLLTHHVFTNYLYIDETHKCLSEKARINLHYKALFEQDNRQEEHTGRIVNFSSLTLSYENYQLSDDTTVVDAKGEHHTLPLGTPYIEFTITRAKDAASVDHFLRIFARLMSLYENLKPIVKERFSDYISKKKKKTITSTPLDNSKIQVLKKTIPGVFDNKFYSSTCPCMYQPILIDKKDKEDWESYSAVSVDGIPQQRHVQPFAYQSKDAHGNEVEKEALFVCPDNQYPYFILSKKKYPCCTDSHKAGSRTDPVRSTKGKNRLQGLKVSAVGSEGTGPELFSELFPQHNGEWIRYHCQEDLLSGLHAVLTAVNPNYLHLQQPYRECKRDVDRTEYCQTVKDELSEFPFALFKQENWNQNAMKDDPQFVDPAGFFNILRYFRGLEELYHVTIVVVEYTGDESVTRFLSPPGYGYHCRQHKADRPVVVLLQHYGSVEYPDHPHFDVLVYKTGQEKMFTFEGDMGMKMWELYQYCNPQFTSQASLLSYQISDVFRPLYRFITGQHIDVYGKCRGFNIDFGDDQPISVFFDPTFPIQAPETRKVHYVDKHADVLKKYFQCSSVEKDRYGYHISYQTTMLDEQLYVLCYVPSVKGSPRVINEASESITHQLNKTRVMANRFIELMEWLYLLYFKTEDSETTLETFIQRWDVIGSEKDEYQIENFGMYFPPVTTFKEAMNYIEKKNLDMCRKGRILITNPLLKSKLIVYLKKFHSLMEDMDMEDVHDHNMLLVKKEKQQRRRAIKRTFKDHYANASDFHQTRNVKVFFGNDMFRYLQSQERETTMFQAPSVIHLSQMEEIEPFYVTFHDHVYLVQNVKNGEKARAMHVASVWKDERRNVGDLDTHVYESSHDASKYQIVTIQNKGQLSLSSTYSLSSMYLVEYNMGGIKTYAAMLRL